MDKKLKAKKKIKESLKRNVITQISIQAKTMYNIENWRFFADILKKEINFFASKCAKN